MHGASGKTKSRNTIFQYACVNQVFGLVRDIQKGFRRKEKILASINSSFTFHVRLWFEPADCNWTVLNLKHVLPSLSWPAQHFRAIKLETLGSILLISPMILTFSWLSSSKILSIFRSLKRTSK